MSDTPVTDAVEFEYDPQCKNVVNSDFARNLERELNALQKENQELRDKLFDFLRDLDVMQKEIKRLVL